MHSSHYRRRQRLRAARDIFEHIADNVDARFSVRLWDGTMIPLGRNVDPQFFVSISGPGVIGSILRRPTLENILRHYAAGQIDFQGGDLIAFGEAVRAQPAKGRLKRLSKSLLLRQALPLLLTPPDQVALEHGFNSEITGRDAGQRENKDFIQFHYDVSNEFYQLWLDPEMQYSCAYFTDWNNSLEQAQLDKLEMICRKLRLQKGDRLLDIGCGWGGLVCYAAQNYGVRAHGVTLSQRQLDFALAIIVLLGLQVRVTVELRDYT
jgi:cyclopropane-fatty-acyl-phospholipid synthase